MNLKTKEQTEYQEIWNEVNWLGKVFLVLFAPFYCTGEVIRRVGIPYK